MIEDRLAAVRALEEMIGAVSRRSGSRAQRFDIQRSDVLAVALAALPVIALGLEDADPQVRRASAEANRQAALALTRLASDTEDFGRPTSSSSKEPDAARELERLRADLQPLAQALMEQAPKLGARLTDENQSTCVAAAQALEALADARLRLRKIRGVAVAADRPQLDDLLATGLRTSLPIGFLSTTFLRLPFPFNPLSLV